MKLYLLFGYGGEEEFKYFYGCFSDEEKANNVKKDLEENPYGDKDERFEIEEHTLNEPTDLYHFMMEP